MPENICAQFSIKPRPTNLEVEQLLKTIEKKFEMKTTWADLSKKYGYYCDLKDRKDFLITFMTLETPRDYIIDFTVGSGHLDAHFDAEIAFANAHKFIELFKATALFFDKKAEYGIAEDEFAFVDKEGIVYPALERNDNFLVASLPVLWINYYPPGLTEKIGQQILLNTPAYKTEVLGNGVLIQTSPLPDSCMPYELPPAKRPSFLNRIVSLISTGREPYEPTPRKPLKGLKKELSDFRHGMEEKLDRISAYFKEHKILEKLDNAES